MNIQKTAYIRQIGDKKFRVYSEKGKNMGTYTSRAAAKKRLRDIEYFKHKNSAEDNHLFPRGGEGKVPEFFRRNLDYGERDEALKKRISKLKITKSALDVLGLKKEASRIKNNIKSLLLNAFLSLSLFGGAVYSANQSLESGKLKEIMADFALEESPNLEEKKIVFELNTPVDNMMQAMYPDVPIENKKDIILEFIKEYNPNLNFEDGTLQLKQTELIKHTHRAEVAYPDLKKIIEKLIKKLSSGYDPSEVGRAGEMSISPAGVEFIMTGEGFSSKIYNDNSSFKWPRDKNEAESKRHWMIGYGHQLQPDELDTGIIEISPTERVRWTDGISEEEAAKIKKKDLVRVSILKSGIDPNEELTKGMYDSFVDVSYNLGPERLERILNKSKDESGNFNIDLFSRELGTWTKVVDPAKKKGIQIRRISQILMARGILLPENPENTKQMMLSYDLNMATPNKNIIHDYIKYFSKSKKIEERTVELLLKKVSNTPIQSFEDFVKILKDIS
jgi:GH24 family phage-related lysozyme (muramidase)